MIQKQEEEDANPETDKRREERHLSHGSGLLHRRDQKTPYGGGGHDAGGEAGEDPGEPVAQTIFYKKNAGRAQRGSQKRNQNAVKRLKIHHIPPE